LPALALLLLSVLATAGCGDKESVPIADLGTRAVVLGIDGADWKLIDALVAEGRMPNLTRLREIGVSGPIATLPDIALSPVIWTSVATGKTVDKHGIAWFMVDQPDGTRVPVRSYNRKVEAIWNLLAAADRKVSVVGWWATYPAEPVGNGLIVSDALGFHGFGSTAREGDDGKKIYPPERYADFSSHIEPVQSVPYSFAERFLQLSPAEFAAERYEPARDSRLNPNNPIHLFQEYAVTAAGYTEILEKILETREDDLTMAYFEQVDSFSHLFMKYDPPQLEWIDDEGYARYQKVVREWYVYQDELLGRILAKIDLETTALFILSDHGFKSGDRRIRSEETVDIRRAHLDHERDGILLAAGPHIRKGATIEGASVLDVTPTLLYYLGFPVARDMDGRILGDLFESGFSGANRPTYIASYETDADGVAEVSEETLTESELAEQERGLRALGYLGSSSGGVSGEASPVAAEDGESSSPEIHNNLGRVLLAKGEIDRAQIEFEKALGLDPNNANALLNMGTIRRVKGQVSDAEYLVKRALQVDPNSISALCQLAEIKRDLGQLDESIRLYNEALRIDDSQPFVFLGLGDSLQRANRLDEAERAFVSVLELTPDSFAAHYNLGVTLTNQGRIDEARVRFEKALELEPQNPSSAFAHNNLGDLDLRAGNAEGAMAHFRSAAKVSPGHLESRYNLAVLLLERGESEEAVELLEAAAQIQPDHEQVASALAMTYLGQGRLEDAAKSFTLVRRLHPSNWTASIGMALVYASAGDPGRAQQEMNEAIRVGGEAARQEAERYPILAELPTE